MAQGKSKSSKTGSQYSYKKRKKDARHGKINKSSTTNHHLSQPKPENIPSKKKEEINDKLNAALKLKAKKDEKKQKEIKIRKYK